MRLTASNSNKNALLGVQVLRPPHGIAFAAEHPRAKPAAKNLTLLRPPPAPFQPTASFPILPVTAVIRTAAFHAS